MPSQLLVLYKLYLRDVLQDARDCVVTQENLTKMLC